MSDQYYAYLTVVKAYLVNSFTGLCVEPPRNGVMFMHNLVLLNGSTSGKRDMWLNK